MTSKEELRELIAEATSVNINYERLCFFETKLMNELEILEIIKKYYDISTYGTWLHVAYKSSAPIAGIDPKEIEKIKGWLENEK